MVSRFSLHHLTKKIPACLLKVHAHCVPINSDWRECSLCSGQTPADAEFNFLEVAKNLDLYGVDLHFAKVITVISTANCKTVSGYCQRKIHFVAGQKI